MRPVNAERPRPRNTASIDPLDSIVTEVFRSLVDHEPARNGETVGRRLRRREDIERRSSRPPALRTDDQIAKAPTASQRRNEGAPITTHEALTAPEVELLGPTGMERPAPADTLAISAADQAFLDSAIAFLKSRPNPELHLELLWTSIVDRPPRDVAEEPSRSAPECADDASRASDAQKEP